jgi:MFS family permease
MRRLFALVAAIVLVDTMFFAALTPLLPRYADELDLTKAEAGLLAAAYPLGVLVAGLPAGFAAARYGVKPTVLAGLAVMAATTLTFGFAESIWLLDAARFAQGLASAFAWAAGLAWLTDAAPAGRRGELIGSAMAAAIVGALLGPLVGAAAAELGPEVAFGTIAVHTVGLGIWAAVTPGAPPSPRRPVSVVLRALATRPVLRSSWLVALPALLFGVLGVLAPLRLADLGVSPVGIGAAFLLAAALEASLAPLLGRLSDRRGRLALLRVSLMGATVVAATLPWLDNRWLLGAGVVAAGITFGSFWAPALAQLADEAEALGLEHAYGFALVNIAWAPGQAAGAAVGGALAQATSDAVPFLLLAAACALTLRALRGPAAARRARPQES